MFKSIIASTLFAATSFFAAPPAEAARGYCYTTSKGYDVCIIGVWKDGPNHKIVKSVVDGTMIQRRVYCNPAHRHNYKENMMGIACFQFN